MGDGLDSDAVGWVVVNWVLTLTVAWGEKERRWNKSNGSNGATADSDSLTERQGVRGEEVRHSCDMIMSL